VTGSIVE